MAKKIITTCDRCGKKEMDDTFTKVDIIRNKKHLKFEVCENCANIIEFIIKKKV